MKLAATVLVALALTSCGRSFRSCAAYIAILGPTTITLTCPPPGFVGSETISDDTTNLREN
jgi:hypothetical protein